MAPLKPIDATRFPADRAAKHSRSHKVQQPYGHIGDPHCLVLKQVIPSEADVEVLANKEYFWASIPRHTAAIRRCGWSSGSRTGRMVGGAVSESAGANFPGRLEIDLDRRLISQRPGKASRMGEFWRAAARRERSNIELRIDAA